jgi:chorismate mutase/prephenate dehydratase
MKLKTTNSGAPVTEVAYLGPEGTYSHLVAEKRYGHRCKLLPLPAILDVCAFVVRKPAVRRGIIPIENSSGGAIYETVDILLENRPPVCIQEELSLDVKLALLGRKGEKVKVLYSHFAPIEHCVTWLARRMPGVERRLVATTAIAAQRASVERNAASLGNRRLGRIWDLDVLQYPVQADVPNVTVFLAVGGTRRIVPHAAKTTLAVKLPNRPGALCTFLEAFRNENVNLSRLISRPIRGSPREYAFLIDVDRPVAASAFRRALKVARQTCVEVKMVGSYPAHRAYAS